MRTYLLQVALLSCFSLALGQSQSELTTKKVVSIAEGITASDLEVHLSILASDAYEGRETGTPGQKKAAAYIADQFEKRGLPKIGEDDSFFQKISFISENWNEISFAIQDSTYRNLWDYYAYPSTNYDNASLLEREVLFLGFGIDDPAYSDYEGEDVSGKLLLVFDGEPTDNNGISQITNAETPSDWATDWRKKVRLAKERNAAGIYIIDRNFKANVAQARKVILNRQLQYGSSESAEYNYIPNIFISSTLVETLLGKKVKKLIRARRKIEKKGKSKSFTFETNTAFRYEKSTNELIGENVLGYIEGTDPAVKDEIVVVTAHYDHLGKRGDAVYNGADDNASGTSTVLEVNEAFVEAKQAGIGPRRSVLTMLVSGEEKGLLGSAYYSDHPIFPIENTVANVNVDMVGRVDPKHEGNPDYIYVIGADRLSTELHEINEAANAAHTNLELDYTYNEEDDPNRYYYRSDHYNFAEKGVPAIFYFNGTHADYHRTSDTMEKINFEKMAKIGRLVFYTAWELANREKRIVVDVVDGK